MFLRPVISALCLVVLGGTPPALADRPLGPSYPSIPPDYTTLRVQRLIANAKVNFPAYVVDRTDGYRVTTPSGTKYIVDNIVQPKCAFYATYVDTNDSDHLTMSSSTEVVSNVYIGEVNFANCQ
jgi:hypothetical protein